MEYIPLIALCISSLFSTAAIVISIFSLRNSQRAQRSSEDAQHHTQIVSYEQRRQEVRQIFLDMQILTGEINGEFNRLPDSTWLREKVSQLAVSRHRDETFLRDFDKIPLSPSTEARLKLERIGEAVKESRVGLQSLLKAVRDNFPSK